MSALAWPVWRIVAVFVLTASAPSIQNACRDTGPAAEPDPDDRVVTASDGTRVRVEVVATGLEVPWSLAFVPDGRLLVTERPGRVRVLANGQLVPEPALALDDVYASAEAGTMGIAVDPRFEENGLVYLLYTRDRPGRGPVNRVVRYRELGNVLAEATVLLDGIPASFLHDGGRIRFGPDGLLYVTMGDVLEADDAQDLAAMTGKILRIDRHGRTPPGNPYSSPVYSWGHRNPQGIDWHPLSGALWATEHGNVGNDEVNRIEAGANYGWPVIEGERIMPGMEALLYGHRHPRVSERLLLRHAPGRAPPPAALRPRRPDPHRRRRAAAAEPLRPAAGRRDGTGRRPVRPHEQPGRPGQPLGRRRSHPAAGPGGPVAGAVEPATQGSRKLREPPPRRM